MVRKMLLVLVAAALLAGVTPPASAAESSARSKDSPYVWIVKCNCYWDFTLEFYDYHGAYQFYEDYCTPHEPIYYDISEPARHEEISLRSTLDYPGFRSEHYDVEEYFDGRFTVDHQISQKCWFRSTVEKAKHH